MSNNRNKQTTFHTKKIRFKRWIKRSIKRFSETLRNFRNFITLRVIQLFPASYQGRLFSYLIKWFYSLEKSPYQHVGQCIYCGSKSELTDEHIVPAGLGGKKILFKASCKECQLKIHNVEEACLKAVRDIRYKNKIGTRRLKERSEESHVWVLNNWNGTDPVVPPGENPNQKWELQEIPYSDQPAFVGLPYFKEPQILRYLSKKPNQNETIIEQWFYFAPPTSGRILSTKAQVG